MAVPVILLGAGASIPAGGLTLKQLQEVYEAALKRHPFKDQMVQVFRWVKDTLISRLGYDPNFELVLSAMQDIYDYWFEEKIEVPEYRYSSNGDVIEDSRDVWMPIRSTLHHFFGPPDDPFLTNTLGGQWGFIQTITDLLKQFEDLIKLLAKRIDPSRFALDFIPSLSSIAGDSDAPVEVFTLNYDTLVEETCDKVSVPWTTGFSPSWDPVNLDKLQKGVRLHKLHGSVWWETGRVLGSDPGLEISETKSVSSSPLLIYPLLVKNLSHPVFTELLARFARALRTSNRLVIIGSSLSDAHLCAHILFGMLHNPELSVLILSPDAKEAKSNLLRQAYMWKRSQLVERILTYPKGVEEVSLADLIP